MLPVTIRSSSLLIHLYTNTFSHPLLSMAKYWRRGPKLDPLSGVGDLSEMGAETFQSQSLAKSGAPQTLSKS